MSMNEAYYADCEQIEQLMFFEKNAFRIIKAIEGSKAYSLEGLIDAEDVEVWKEKLIFDYSQQPHNKLQAINQDAQQSYEILNHNNKNNHLHHTKYISEQHIHDYIKNCAKECIAYLKCLPYFQN